MRVDAVHPVPIRQRALPTRDRFVVRENPPGQATLQSLKTASGGVHYFPITGSAQTELRVSDVITISKSLSYTTGMQITITDGQTILWTGVL